MKTYRITSVSDIGNAVRMVRKVSGVRQDDVAGSAGVSHVYLRDLERGKETSQIGRALQVLAELGIKVALELPNDVYERLEHESLNNQKKVLNEREASLHGSIKHSAELRQTKEK